MSQTRRKVLFITLEPISRQMAGPAIRAVELARQLADEFDVTVFSPRRSDLPDLWARDQKLTLVTGKGRRALYELASGCDAIFAQANVLKPYPRLGRLGVPLAVDLYDPYLLSVLAQYKDDPASASSSYRLMHQVLEKHMTRADFSVCASERQRDYWIGRYCALGRLDPEMYEFDPTFRKLIDVVPFGLPDKSPSRSGKGMRGNIAGIEEGDFVLLWGGGIWEWFDPLTVIEATALASRTQPRVKLFFMGWRSPNPQVEVMPMAHRARELAEKLGVLDRHVFFGDGWIPYEDRVNYLLDADLAVSAHFDLPETRFSFRTRILDYFWAGLPIITTGGDHLADLIDRHRAGLALDYGDVGAWAAAITELSGAAGGRLLEEYRAGSRGLAERFTWSAAAEPLRRFCRQPYRLPEFRRVTMPSLLERAQAIYTRGGKELVLRRSKDILSDFLKK